MSILLSLFIVAVIALDKAIASSDDECGENQLMMCDYDCIEPTCANQIMYPEFFCNLRPSGPLYNEFLPGSENCVPNYCSCARGFLRDQTSMNECVAPSDCPVTSNNKQLAGPDVPGGMGISVYKAVQRIIDEHEAAAENKWQKEAAEIRRNNMNADEILKDKHHIHNVLSRKKLTAKIYKYYEELETLENKNT